MSEPAEHIATRYNAAQEIAREAGELALEHFRNRDRLTAESKGVQDIVSAADREVEALIRDRLGSSFPNDDFLGEESGLTEASRDSRSGIWVVDPIDGTACFLTGIPAWSVSIAYAWREEVALGVVADPCAGNIYGAARGAGAWLDGKRLSVSSATNVADGSVGMGFSHRSDPAEVISFASALLGAGGMYFRNGSGALMLAYVAAGRLIGYYEPHINSWDCLAGIALVREAGGWTSDFLANGGLYSGNPLVASAPGVSKMMRRFAGL
ncbi:MAG: inositol monophosphatase family protein [Alphaproteobacteria bacterium]